MKVFITGGSGFVGSRVIVDLLEGGHEVFALARSDTSETKLKGIDPKVNVVRGGLEDLDALKKAAQAADGVIHLGFILDFSDFEKSCQIDRAAVDAIAGVLEGTNKPFIYTGGTLVLAGALGTEDDDREPTSTRGKTERAVLAYKDKGVRAIVIRLSVVHGEGDEGFIPSLVATARKNGAAYYVGEGENVWSAVHLFDTSKLYVLALEKGGAGKVYHAVAEEGIKTKDIAAAIGKTLGVPSSSLAPDRIQEKLGFLGFLFSLDNPTSGEKTRKELGWKPSHQILAEDIKQFYGDQLSAKYSS